MKENTVHQKAGFSLILIIIVVTLLAVLGFVVVKQVSRKDSGGFTAPSAISQSGRPEEKLVALGSSMSRASNLSSNMQGENNEYSFSTGSKIDSIYTYLKAKEKSLTATNLASPGADMQDILDRQLPEALRFNPKYITIDPASDLVGKSSISSYKKNLNQILDKINPQTIIMIFTYPNFLSLRSAGYSSCQENKVGVNLENLSEKNIYAFNQVIEDVARDRENVILIDIYDLLGPEDVSDYDCLHTNLNAQKKIAAEFIKKLDSRGGD